MVALWMVVASGFFALMGACIKLASTTVGFSTSFLSFSHQCADRRGADQDPAPRFSHPSSRIAYEAGGDRQCGDVLRFYSLIHLPIATATTLGYTNPLFQSAIAFITTRGQLTGRLLFSVLLGFTGILVLLRPDAPNGEYVATLVGLAAGLLTALAYFTSASWCGAVSRNCAWCSISRWWERWLAA